MPDPNYLVVALLVSSIGFVMFMYGKKQRRPLQFAGGLTLLIFPYFLHNVLWMSVVTVLICAAVWGGVKMGL